MSKIRKAAAALVVVLALSACATTTASTSDTLVVGMASDFGVLDPAGPLAGGSSQVQAQVFGRLLDTIPGTTRLEPELAATAAFTTPNDFTVTLHPGLRFANGHLLTSSDVVFSIMRLRTIKAKGGAVGLLGNLATVTATDPRTVVFHLTTPNDQTFARTLGTVAGSVVDEQEFSATALATNEQVVAGHGFSGPYDVDSFHTRLITLNVNSSYRGLTDAPSAIARSSIALKSYADSANLAHDLRDGAIDVALPRLASADIAALKTATGVRLVEAPGSEVRAIAFNPKAMPFGSGQPNANPTQALAVRQAVADILNRSDLASAADENSTAPLFAYVPKAATKVSPILTGAFGDGAGGPSVARAVTRLTDAGVATPVTITLIHLPDAESVAEFERVANQLQSSRVFTVTSTVVASTEGTVTPFGAGQLVIDSRIADADSYLRQAAAWKGTGNSVVTGGLAQEFSDTDQTSRATEIDSVQAALASQLFVIPLLQTRQIVATRVGVTGVALNSDSVLRFVGLGRR